MCVCVREREREREVMCSSVTQLLVFFPHIKKCTHTFKTSESSTKCLSPSGYLLCNEKMAAYMYINNYDCNVCAFSFIHT